MNRVLNVCLLSVLAATLACSPASRRQVKPTVNKQNPQPTATPTNPGPVVQGNPTIQLDPAKQATKIDLNTAKLVNVDVYTTTMNNAPAFNLSFTLSDAAKNTSTSYIIVDGKSPANSNDPNVSQVLYQCQKGDHGPVDCADSQIKFNYGSNANKLQGSVEILQEPNLSVTEYINNSTGDKAADKAARAADKAAGKNVPKNFGKAFVQRVTFTLGDITFNRINAEVAATGKTCTAPDDIETNDTGIRIAVCGLPSEDLDKNPIKTAPNSKGRPVKDFMASSDGSWLGYSIPITADDSTSTTKRTLWLKFPSSSAVTGTPSVDPIAAAGTDGTGAGDAAADSSKDVPLPDAIPKAIATEGTTDPSKGAAKTDGATDPSKGGANTDGTTDPSKGAAKTDGATDPSKGGANTDGTTDPSKGAAKTNGATDPSKGAAKTNGATDPSKGAAKTDGTTDPSKNSTKIDPTALTTL